MTPSHFVSWLHIGDLHASCEDGWESVAVLERIVDAVRRHVPAGALDFAFLPGDNANHGERGQYRRVMSSLSRLALPLYAIPGDHDFEPGSLDPFHQEMAAWRLPAMVRVGGRRALFLDIVSAGTGGPDFRLGDAQMAWLRNELADVRAASEPRPIVFMHAFPGDLREGAHDVGRLFADARVAFVDTGHTHYNELLNDGTVIYSATRSTGQIEEGPAGFAIAAVDGNAASWRFKTLDSGWPWVSITAPADVRMAVEASTVAPDDALEVHALVLGPDVAAVKLRIDDKAEVPMLACADRPGLWTGTVRRPADAAAHRIRVDATASSGETANDEIRFCDAPGGRAPEGFGDHRHTVGAWPDHDLLGTRLGPNANGKGW